MALRLGITGMDSSTETALRSAFQQAQAQLGDSWTLVPEAEADHVVVDMDSMYGPMSWIRLHAAGKHVIGLTTSPRTQADHRLPRPFDTATLAGLLASIAAQPSAPATGPAAVDAMAGDHEPDAAAAAGASGEAGTTAAATEPPPETGPTADAAAPHRVAEPEVAASPVTTAQAQGLGFAEWLTPGVLGGRWRLVRGGASVAFDADARVYHGPAALKPLAPLFEGDVFRDELEALDQAGWTPAAAGEPQPLSRLQWYGALLAGRGRLLPGNDPDGRYRLVKWPQTEREFPKHFRIATAMMKGPATVAEIASASGTTPEEVADFVNANLATGFAEAVEPEPQDVPESPRAGLLGRLRGR